MPDRAQLEAVMVRRMKSELKLRWDGSRRFAERMVKHLEVPYTEDERLAHHNLQKYSELRLKNASSEGERLAAEFVLKLLKKRLFSSPAAFGITLDKHIKTISGLKGATPIMYATLTPMKTITPMMRSMRPKSARSSVRPARHSRPSQTRNRAY